VGEEEKGTAKQAHRGDRRSPHRRLSGDRPPTELKKSVSGRVKAESTSPQTQGGGGGVVPSLLNKNQHFTRGT